jgi:class 3 adenylate cyclase
MNPFRTIVIMKTDVSGSTSRFRGLLAADLQALLAEHRTFVARHAEDHGGRIIKAAGDGYWLEFPSVTAAAKSAIAMQEALRLAQLNRGDQRLAIRIVIALGDVAVQDGDFVGEAFALATRVESITPPDEIYLTAAARLALTSATEIQIGLVETFAFKGFDDAMPVYRIQQRHRTRIIADIFILRLDITGFGRIMAAEPAGAAVERILDTLDTMTHGIAQQFSGEIRYSVGDSYCITFMEAEQAIAGAEQLARSWDANQPELSGCAIGIGLHRGTTYTFRSFLYGRDVRIAALLQDVSAKLLAIGESGVFVTGTVRDALFGFPWHNRLQPVELKPVPTSLLAGIDCYRLCEAPPEDSGRILRPVAP